MSAEEEDPLRVSFATRRRTAVFPLSLLLGVLSGCGGQGAAPPPTLPTPPAPTITTVTADVVVYGATPSGISAAVEAAHLGKQVVLLEPGQHVGGMMSNGLGYTDLYDLSALGGLVKTFFSTVESIYGASETDDHSGTRFEPHVAEQAFNQMLAQQKSLQVVFNAPVSSVAMNGTSITSIAAGTNTIYAAKEFIDASYEGDLMAAANVSNAVGREPAAQYNESIGGVGVPGALNGLAVDPYVVPGDPSSGLLQHIEPITLGSATRQTPP
jgi:hypothetical protein